MKWISAILLSLILAFPIYADVSIPKENRIHNFYPGYCTWCCLETLGRYHKIEKLYNLVKNRQSDPDYIIWDEWNGYYIVVEPRNTGSCRAVTEKLRSLGVKFRIQWDGNRDDGMIREAVKNDGCVVTMREGAFGPEAHSIIVTSYNDKKVQFINPNDISYYECTREWFEYYWTGAVCVVYS